MRSSQSTSAQVGTGNRNRSALMEPAGWGETFAQSTSTFSQDFRLWSPVFLTVKLPSSFLVYLEVQPRFADLDDAGHIDQLLLRPALGYQLTENVSIWQVMPGSTTIIRGIHRRNRPSLKKIASISRSTMRSSSNPSGFSAVPAWRSAGSNMQTAPLYGSARCYGERIPYPWPRNGPSSPMTKFL